MRFYSHFFKFLFRNLSHHRFFGIQGTIQRAFVSEQDLKFISKFLPARYYFFLNLSKFANIGGNCFGGELTVKSAR